MDVVNQALCESGDVSYTEQQQADLQMYKWWRQLDQWQRDLEIQQPTFVFPIVSADPAS